MAEAKMDVRTAAAHLRPIIAQQVRPLLYLEEILQAALEAESQVGALTKQASALQELVRQSQGQVRGLEAEISRLEGVSGQAIKAAEGETKAIAEGHARQKADLQGQFAVMQRKYKTLEEEAKARLEALAKQEKEAKDRVEALRAEFTALHQRAVALGRPA